MGYQKGNICDKLLKNLDLTDEPTADVFPKISPEIFNGQHCPQWGCKPNELPCDTIWKGTETGWTCDEKTRLDIKDERLIAPSDCLNRCKDVGNNCSSFEFGFRTLG